MEKVYAAKERHNFGTVVNYAQLIIAHKTEAKVFRSTINMRIFSYLSNAYLCSKVLANVQCEEINIKKPR